jgi:hypothetical protein
MTDYNLLWNVTVFRFRRIHILQIHMSQKNRWRCMLFGVQVGMVDIEIDRDYVSVCKSEQFCWLRAISNVWETLSLPTLRWWYPPADAASISTSCSCSQFQRWTQLRKKQAGVDRAAGLAANKPVWQPEDWVWEVFVPGEKRSLNFAMVWGLNQYLLMYSSYFAFCLLLSMCELSQHASFGLEEDPEVLSRARNWPWTIHKP